jgi:hypothetical protein
MKKKSLFDTNPYLRDPKKYRESLITNVSSSTSIETGSTVESVSKQLTEAAGAIFDITPTQPKSKS